MTMLTRKTRDNKRKSPDSKDSNSVKAAAFHKHYNPAPSDKPITTKKTKDDSATPNSPGLNNYIKGQPDAKLPASPSPARNTLSNSPSISPSAKDFRKKLAETFGRDKKSPPSYQMQERKTKHQMYVIIFKSGEMVAYAADRYKPTIPAYTKNITSMIEGYEAMRKNMNIHAIMCRRSEQDANEHWSIQKSTASGQNYRLKWFSFVRVPEADKSFGVKDANKWCQFLVDIFNGIEKEHFAKNQGIALAPNEFEAAGCITPDEDSFYYAGDFFTNVDTMDQLIIPAIGTHLSRMEIAEQHNFLLLQYFGPNRCQSVTNFFLPAGMAHNTNTNNDDEDTPDEYKSIMKLIQDKSD